MLTHTAAFRCKVTAFCLGAALTAGFSWAQTSAGTLSLPDYSVSAPTVANDQPVGAIATPVSALRFEPRADVQARNLAETQADIAIRGGVFEASGFKIGATAIFDPQTGHYLAELPVPPAMLSAPSVLVGEGNAAAGFNATAGTVAYAWRPITGRNELSVMGGDYGYNKQSLYASALQPVRSGQPQLGADAEWTRSESDGSRPYGESNLQRAAGRVQRRTASNQTDLFFGYQHKYFGWPNLYTPFGYNETDNLQTILGVLNSRWTLAGGSRFELGAYYRRNKDDYEFNRASPGASNPFQHTTWMRGLAAQGTWEAAMFTAHYALQFAQDALNSTSLVYGPFTSRDYTKLVLEPEKSFAVAQGTVLLRGGATWDQTNRDGAQTSPLLHAEWRQTDTASYYVEYAGSTQVASYTALKSSATSGLFRGNQNLGRETSRNLEAGLRRTWNHWSMEADIFRRWDDELVDWTYRRGVTARTANPVDLTTSGAELILRRHTARYDLTLGYSYLRKSADYGSASVDASFYALNFPRQRVTAALIWKLGSGWELRADNEYRVQEPNYLRTAGGEHAWLSSLGVYYRPPGWTGWEFSVLADNLWNSQFQEVPAVPASARQIAAGITRRW